MSDEDSEDSGTEAATTSDSEFEEPEAELGQLGLEQIAAVHAALNPERREWRQDIILGASVEILASRGDLTDHELVRALQQMWGTTSITWAVVEPSLTDGLAAGLLRRVDSLATTKWSVASSAKKEAEEDRGWARSAIQRFETDLARLLEDAGVAFKAHRLPVIANHLVSALAVGAASLHAVDDPGATQWLRPSSFDQEKVRLHLEGVDPRSVREALWDAAVAAMDPCDDFGNEVVHLLAVGNLLRGLVGRHDIEEVDLSGVRVLLDTSVLVDLVGEVDQQQVVNELISVSMRLGVEIIVADHSVAEWERLWNAADAEHPERIEHLDVPLELSRLTANPFVTAFLRSRATEPRLSWAEFQRRWFDLRKLLEPLGVNVRPAGNTRKEDLEVRESALAVMAELIDNGGARRRRANAVEADAESYTMIVRWRDRSPQSLESSLPCGFFVARDHLVGRVHKRLCPEDTFPLTVKPAAWLLMVAAACSADPTERAAYAQLLGRSVVRDSFFGVATGYTLEDALALAEILEEGQQISEPDVRAALQLDLLSLEEGQPVSAENVAAAVIRRRSQRRDERARRAEEAANEAKQEAARAQAEATAKVTQLETVIAQKDRDLSELSKRSDDQEESGRRLRRALISLVIAVVLAGVTTAVWLGGGLAGGRGVVLTVVASVIFLGAAADWIMNLQRRWWEVALGVAFNLALVVLGSVLPANSSPPKDPAPSITTTSAPQAPDTSPTP